MLICLSILVDLMICLFFFFYLCCCCFIGLQSNDLFQREKLSFQYLVTNYDGKFVVIKILVERYSGHPKSIAATILKFSNWMILKLEVQA